MQSSWSPEYEPELLVRTASWTARARVTTFDHAGIGASSATSAISRSTPRCVRSKPSRHASLTTSSPLSEPRLARASAALYATRHPDRVRALACVNPVLPLAAALSAAEMRENWSLAPPPLAGWPFILTGSGLQPALVQQRHPRVHDGRGRRRLPARSSLAQTSERSTGASPYLRSFMSQPAEAARDAPRARKPGARLSRRVTSPEENSPTAASAILEFMGVDTAPDQSLACSFRRGARHRHHPLHRHRRLHRAHGAHGRHGVPHGVAHARRRVRAAMRETGGTPVDGKVLGDGVMGVFTSASQAIAAARRCIELSAANCGCTSASTPVT